MAPLRRILRFGSLAALVSLLAGCPGRIDDPLAFRQAASDVCPSDYDVEEDLFVRTCGTLGCHTGGPSVSAAGLDLTTAGVADRLLTHVSSNEACGERELITPGDMAGSFLIEKVVDETPSCGIRMPSNLPPLNATEMRCLQEYVAALAGDEGGRDAGVPQDAGMPAPGVDAGPEPMPDVDAGMPMPLEGVTIQAESMTLTGYVVDPTDDTVIRLPDATPTGNARAVFDGAVGMYQLTVHVVAEPDGTPQLTIRLPGIELATVDYPLTDMANEPRTLGPYDVMLRPGDEIVLEGASNGGAWARIDYVEVAP